MQSAPMVRSIHTRHLKGFMQHPILGTLKDGWRSTFLMRTTPVMFCPLAHKIRATLVQWPSKCRHPPSMLDSEMHESFDQEIQRRHMASWHTYTGQATGTSVRLILISFWSIHWSNWDCVFSTCGKALQEMRNIMTQNSCAQFSTPTGCLLHIIEDPKSS